MDTAERANFPADPAQGYFLTSRASPGFSMALNHRFCGPHDVGGAWCPNCKKPLLRFFALDTRDNRINVQETRVPTLSLFFCWTCNVAQETFFYRDLGDAIEIIQCGQGGVEAGFPYEDYPTFFPGSAAVLEMITAEEQAVVSRLNSRFETNEPASKILGQRHHLWNVRHQVGGEPFLTQGLAVLVCPDCGTDMPFLASVANDCLDPRGLVGDDTVQVLYYFCRKCRVVGVYQMAD